MRLYNTMSRQIEAVRPRDGAISIYVCGVTPYDVGHLGHCLTYLTYDVIRRRLESEGVRVRHVQNITDVDDDIIRKARELGETPEAVTDRNVALFDRDMAALNALPAHEYPKVSGTMPAIIDIVGRLIESGHAYVDGEDVYFDVARFPEYGALSRFSPERMLAENRAQKMRPGPRDPLDFLLWQEKAAGEPSWRTPWGEGRPGWHIECSAMALETIGTTVDIHGGGADLIFPHHECEIAQSESATGAAPFVRTWAHIGMLRYQGEKMSKSLGNLVLASDLLGEHSSDAIRLALYTRHYRDSWEWTDETLEAGAALAARFANAAAIEGGDGPAVDAGPATARAWAAIDDDLRLAEAVEALLPLADAIVDRGWDGGEVASAQREFRRVADVLGLSLRSGRVD